MGLANNFDIGSNFWKSNPQLTIGGAFKDLYDLDKSKDKETSSRIMWAIAFMYDPDSKFANIPTDKRAKIIEEDFLKIKNFSWDAYKAQVLMYLDCVLTPIERMALSMKKKLEERDKFLSETKYTVTLAKDLDAIMSNTKKMYEYYKMIMDDLTKEKSTTRARGNTMESAAEKGLI